MNPKVGIYDTDGDRKRGKDSTELLLVDRVVVDMNEDEEIEDAESERAELAVECAFEVIWPANVRGMPIATLPCAEVACIRKRWCDWACYFARITIVSIS